MEKILIKILLLVPYLLLSLNHIGLSNVAFDSSDKTLIVSQRSEQETTIRKQDKNALADSQKDFTPANTIDSNTYIAEVELISTEHTLEGANSFYLESERAIEGFSFKIINIAGKEYEWENLVQGEGYIENKNNVFLESSINNTQISKLYTFNDGIDKIIIKGQKDISYRVVPVTPQITNNSSGKSSLESTYIKKIFEGAGINIITREEWGAPQQSNWQPYIIPVNRVVVHHTATNMNLADPYLSVREIYNYHYYRCADNSGSYNPSSPRPNCDEPAEWWEDIGYNFLIDGLGNIYEGRAGGLGVVGAHSPPNSGSVGIALIGNYSNVAPQAQAMNSLTKLVAFLSKFNGFNLQWQTNLFGHRNFNNTTCPGNTLYSRIPWILSDVFLSDELNDADDKITDLLASLSMDNIRDSRNRVLIILETIDVDPLLVDIIKQGGVLFSLETEDVNSSRLIMRVDSDFVRQQFIEFTMLDKDLKPKLLYEQNKALLN